MSQPGLEQQFAETFVKEFDASQPGDLVTNFEVLSLASLPSLFTILRQRRLRWLGHILRMEDGRVPKDILYGELSAGGRSTGHAQLRYKDVCKGQVKALNINVESWEVLARESGETL